MKRFEFITKTYSERILVLATYLFCCNTYSAEGEFFLDQFEDYGIEASDFDKMQITPTRLMENKTLFLAAQAERDTSMNMSLRLINNRWLLEEGDSSFSGPEAIRRYLRMYILDRYKKDRQRTSISSDTFLSPSRNNRNSQFHDLSNYRLRVSDDRFRVRFRYTFD